MNTECMVSEKIQPFLEFIVQKTNHSTFSFPSFTYQCTEIPEDEYENTEESPENIHFSNTCFEEALSLLDSKIDIHKQLYDLTLFYKGFIEYDDETLFAVFDMTLFSSRLSKNYMCILDEIVIKKSIYRIPIDPIITDFFIKHPYMQHIWTDTKEMVDIPNQMYICAKIDDSEKYHFKNVEKTKVAMTSFEGILEQINEKIEDPWLGPFYYFSAEPIDTTIDCTRLKRYFVCQSEIESSFFISQDIMKLTEHEKKEHRDHCFHSSMIYFTKNNIEYFCIKSLLAFCQAAQ